MLSHTYTTQLKSSDSIGISLGPITFTSNPNGFIEAKGKTEELLDALHLLYFSANAYKIYYDLKIDPLNSYFENGNPLDFQFEKIDPSLFQALAEILKGRSGIDEEKKSHALRVIQAIKCLNESKNTVHLPSEEWKDYLLISSSFEVLFSLNPAFPAADLRQHLRPLLHLKFSHPVELLWKWVDQFYSTRNALLRGESYYESHFLENPNIKTPTLFIGEKILIYSIYDILFTKHLLEGSPGTPSTPDDFSFIHPERILVYFWTCATLDKKITLLTSKSDLEMISKIKAMYIKLEQPSEYSSKKEIFTL